MPLSRIKNQSVETVMKTGRRNLLINGNAKIWQRSTDFTQSNSSWGYHAMDRFMHNKGRYQQTTETVDGKTVKAIKVSPSSGVYNGGRGFLQRIEDYSIYEHDLILSAWIKSDAAHNVNFGNVWTGSVTSNSKTISVTTDWKQYVIKIPASSHTLTQVPDQYILTSLTDGRTYYTANMQLEFDYGNGIPSPFEYMDEGEELNMCQRYCVQFDSAETGGEISNTFCNTMFWNTAYQGHVFFPQKMRANPSFAHSGVGTFNLHQAGVFTRQPTSVLASNVSKFGARITGNVTYTETQGLSGQLSADGTDTAYLRFTAEL